MKSTRDAFGEALLKLGSLREDIVVLDADLASSTRASAFSEQFGDRFFNVGVSEQDLVQSASGMALCGKVPFACSFAAFLVTRAFDQIRTTVAMPGLNVKLVGTHGGITVGEDGITHQATEDIALMRSLPNMNVLVAADAVAARELTFLSAEIEGPVYLRLGREPVPKVYENNERGFEAGGGRMLKEGDGVTFCTCGIMVYEAISAAEILEKQGIKAEIIDCYSVKPLPEQLILSSLRRTGCCVVAEEHNVIGGLSEAVARLTATEFPVPMRAVAINDRYGQSGSPKELQEYYGLTYREIVGAAAQVWALRRRS
ncbi:MAG: Transketolase central region [Synergistales bacterium 53_16]|jgi:transketolase|nr:MAG: Transketolase central region [Synergistales bacterium 53_16]